MNGGAEMSRPASPPDKILLEAADWRVRRDDGLSAIEEAAFARWVAASPDHARAWQEVCGADAAIARMRFADAGESTGVYAPPRRSRPWAPLMALAGVAAAVGFGFLLIRPKGEPAAAPVPNALIVPAVVRVLPDDSRVELQEAAEIALDFSPAQRRVQLQRGTAYFRVTKDPARPFVVAAGGVQVRAVGTEFAVEEGADHVDVLVAEGTVAVVGPAAVGTSARILVTAGQQISFSSAAGAVPPAPRAIDAAELARRLAWRGPRLRLAATPLREAVRALNEISPQRLIVADAGIASLRLTGNFPAQDARGFARLLQASYGLRVEHRPDGSIALWGR